MSQKTKKEKDRDHQWSIWASNSCEFASVRNFVNLLIKMSGGHRSVVLLS